MNIGFIGTGNMGGALAAAAARAVAENGHIGGRVLLCDSDTAKAEALAARTGGEAVTLADIFDRSDIIFFGVKPQDFPLFPPRHADIFRLVLNAAVLRLPLLWRRALRLRSSADISRDCR